MRGGGQSRSSISGGASTPSNGDGGGALKRPSLASLVKGGSLKPGMKAKIRLKYNKVSEAQVQQGD
jgi:hypothetical protein